MSTKKKLFYGALACIFILLLIKIVPRFLSSGAGGAKTVEPVPVNVAGVTRQTIEETLELTGDIRGLNEARLFPKVPGRLLRKIKDVGDVVAKGEAVALIDRDEPGMQFEPAEVTSPLDGVLTRYFADLGQNVTPAAPVCEVAVVSPVKVTVRVTERDFPRVRVGMAVRFTCDPYPGEAFTGRVSKMSSAMDEATRSADVEIQAANPGRKLKPGMFATVTIIVRSRPGAFVIPRAALAATGVTGHVFVVDASNIARKRPVKIGLVQEDVAEVLTGLNPGEKVVTLGWHNIEDGTPVSVVEQ